MRRRSLVTWAAAAAVPLAHGQPAASADVQVQWQLVQGAVPVNQRLVKVLKGDSLTLRITSDMPGEVHLHAYRLVATVVPGQTAELTFKAHATGRFRFEWHPAGVRVEGAREGHHAPPVAVLEVRPR